MRAEPGMLLVVANSARAIAESAVHGGYRVHIMDAFCDRDTQDLAPCTRVPMAGPGLDSAPLLAGVDALLCGVQGLPAGRGADGPLGLVYGAGFEPCPELLAELARRVRILGNRPGVLALLGSPARLLGLLADLDIAHPESRLDPPPANVGGEWLAKEPGSSGGLGVRHWRPGDLRPAAPHYFQRRQSGLPMSILFVADGRNLDPIGYHRLLTADLDPVRPFLYGGLLGQSSLAPSVRREVEGWCRRLVGTLGLRGINGLDFILDGGHPRFLELNPRPTAALGLYDGQCREGWIGRHVRACLGELPAPSVAAGGRVWGQRVIYAPRDLRVPAGLHWPHWCKDRPQSRSLMPRGAPLCTVLAQGEGSDLLESRLAERAAAVLGLIESGPTLGDPVARAGATGAHRERLQ